MKSFHRRTTYLLLVIFASQTVYSVPVHADLELPSIGHIFAGLHRPKSTCEPNTDDLANQIDRLEFEIETYGSVVPKQPDVWGEARMTKHRQDVERILQERLSEFEVTLNAAVRRSDQSFFATAAALNAAVIADSEGNNTKTAVETSVDLLPDINAEKQEIIDRTGIDPIDLKNFTGDKPAIGLEPTIVLDQLNRYLGHLNELRRINEGDDTSDSPGYAMNLVRIPVSVLPGKKTREGYGAELTFTATPHLTAELLPMTFRNLIVNDVVDQLALPLAQFYNNDHEKTEQLIDYMEKAKARADEGIAAFDAWAMHMRERAEQEITAGRISRIQRREIENYLSNFELSKNYYWERLYELAYVAQTLRADKGETSETVLGVRKTFYVGRKPTSLYIKYVDLDNVALSITQTGGGTLPIRINSPTYGELDNLPLSFNWLQEPKEFLQWIKLVQGTDQMSFPIEIDTSETIKSQDSGALRKYIALMPPELQQFAEQAVGSITRNIMPAIIESFAGKYKGLVSSSLDAYFQNTSASLGGGNTSLRSRRARLPLPPSQMPVVYGGSFLSQIATSVHSTVTNSPVAESTSPIAKKHVHLIDIRRALADELDAAYDLLSLKESYLFWGFANPELIRAVRERDLYTINEMRTNFINALPRHPKRDALKHSVTSALAWGIIVESAFLNEQLLDDMQRVAREKACGCFAQGPLRFYLPKPPRPAMEGDMIPEPWEAEFAAASEAFIEYVRCRWPIHVFALDPAVQEQNVADIFNVRREMQMSLAVGVALGEISAGQAQKHARRMELDMETIDLNRTIVGFSHGADTFGWRFYPRVQAGDAPCYPCTVANTFTGRTLQRDYLIKQRRLEPGMRECVAVVLMPSFVPHVTFESRGSWFKLTNPRHKELTLKDSLRISRDYQCVKNALHCVCDGECYRPGDVAQLSGVVQQMERRLPLQATLVQVPHENRLGGFEMFDTGLTDLSPELLGWYGAPGVIIGGKNDDCRNDGVNYIGADQCKFTCKGTTLFLVGSKFSVHETKVIAGGRCVPFTLLSRDIMRVTIDSNANPLTHSGKQYVDVHVATPYGVTNHLLIPAFTTDEKKDELEELKKSVSSLKQHVVQVEFDPGKHKLVYDVSCKDENPLDLQFRLRNNNDRIPFAYKSLSTGMQGKKAKLKMALYDGSYFNSLLAVPLVENSDSEILLDNSGAPTMLASKLDDLISTLLKAHVPHAKFGTDNKHKLTCQFFLEVPPGADVPVRVAGSLPVELNLKCECCKTTATTASTPATAPPPPTAPTGNDVKPEADAESPNEGSAAKEEAIEVPKPEPAPTLPIPADGSDMRQGSIDKPCDCSALRVVGEFVR